MLDRIVWNSGSLISRVEYVQVVLNEIEIAVEARQGKAATKDNLVVVSILERIARRLVEEKSTHTALCFLRVSLRILRYITFF